MYSTVHLYILLKYKCGFFKNYVFSIQIRIGAFLQHRAWYYERVLIGVPLGVFESESFSVGHLHISMCDICIYIYIYIEREREIDATEHDHVARKV
jgi:uncharacterized membrane protein